MTKRKLVSVEMIVSDQLASRVSDRVSEQISPPIWERPETPVWESIQDLITGQIFDWGPPCCHFPPRKQKS